MKWREEVGKFSFILFFIHGILRYTIFSHRLSSSLGWMWMFVVHREISSATSTLFTRASISYILILSHHHRHHRLMLSSAFTHFRVLFMAGCWLLVAVFHRISFSLVYHPCWLRWRMIRAAARLGEMKRKSRAVARLQSSKLPPQTGKTTSFDMKRDLIRTHHLMLFAAMLLRWWKIILNGRLSKAQM